VLAKLDSTQDKNFQSNGIRNVTQGNNNISACPLKRYVRDKTWKRPHNSMEWTTSIELRNETNVKEAKFTFNVFRVAHLAGSGKFSAKLCTSGNDFYSAKNMLVRFIFLLLDLAAVYLRTLAVELS